MNTKAEAPTEDQSVLIDKMIEVLKMMKGHGIGPRSTYEASAAVTALRESNFDEAIELTQRVSHVNPAWANGSSCEQTRYKLATELRALRETLIRDLDTNPA